MTSHISECVRTIVERPLHGLMKNHWIARADHFATKTEPTIDRADVGWLKQHTVRITMHDALNRTVRAVADRVLVFRYLMIELSNIWNELPRDRIMRIVAVDQPR